jgi:hypothetical protein
MVFDLLRIYRWTIIIQKNIRIIHMFGKRNWAFPLSDNVRTVAVWHVYRWMQIEHNQIQFQLV